MRQTGVPVLPWNEVGQRQAELIINTLLKTANESWVDVPRDIKKEWTLTGRSKLTKLVQNDYIIDLSTYPFEKFGCFMFIYDNNLICNIFCFPLKKPLLLFVGASGGLSRMWARGAFSGQGKNTDATDFEWRDRGTLRLEWLGWLEGLGSDDFVGMFFLWACGNKLIPPLLGNPYFMGIFWLVNEIKLRGCVIFFR